MDEAGRVEAAYGAKFAKATAKATAKVTDDLEVLLAFYELPAGHWQHLRITNPIESTFATARHRTRVTRGPGSRAAGPAWHSSFSKPPRPAGARSTPHLVALVRTGATFVNGKLLERPEESPRPAAA